MPSSDWRSPAAYAHAKSIPAAGFAWEYLRRDEDYRRDFHRVSASRSLNAGGCDFPADPDQSAGSGQVFWLPALLPDAFGIQPITAAADDPAAMPIDLVRLPTIDLRAAVDGARHGLWRCGDTPHQFWMTDATVGGATSYVVLLPLDAFTELRALAILRFWR
eukprot:gene37832-45520_t